MQNSGTRGSNYSLDTLYPFSHTLPSKKELGNAHPPGGWALV
ncbi:hypothetical protein D1BOALGB6SA_7312 [Olavius sp. associated proteobacterium Delta 1]|nr:hypothetical protein D1BOALGB6SA_7312 [Olavius sp. associated proteobacterium Delta 1]